MKKLIATLMMMAGAYGALAQGSVTFITFNAANSASGTTFLNDGTTPAGAGIIGQLWWSTSSNGVYQVFDTGGSPQSFSGGYVNDGAAIISSLLGGDAVWVQMRVWNASAGATWEQAVPDINNPTQNPLLQFYGITASRSRTLGGINSDGDPVPPPSFNNFPNLNLTLVPEPSTMALAGLGLASLLIFRRRK